MNEAVNKKKTISPVSVNPSTWTDEHENFSRRDLDSRSCHSAPDIKEDKSVSKTARLVSHVK
jgi:hypothetical protein